MNAPPKEQETRQRPRRRKTTWARFVTFGIFVLAGLLIGTAAVLSQGTDLRTGRTENLQELIRAQTDRNEALRDEYETLQSEVDELSGDTGNAALDAEVTEAGLAASVSAVTGPGVRVVLTDAPAEVKPAGVDDDDLVVHQQDIQAVVNALWQGGAEAMTIQGQRVIATTGIKCVGNSVVLHGVPYAPPYVIEAIGDQDALIEALNNSPAITIYKQYVEAYGLGYRNERLDEIDMPAFVGSVGIEEAEPTDE